MTFKYLISFLLASVSWATTATISPVVRVRAGASISLTGSGTGTGALTYFWTQLNGPDGKWSTRTSTTPTFTTLLAGSYTLQLKVTDSNGVSALATTILGVTATDNNCVVVTGSTFDRLLNPLLGDGCSPWPYFDKAGKALDDIIAVSALANPPHLGTKLTGTFQVLSDPGRLVGTGSLLTSEAPNGTGLIVLWNSVDGTGTGRHWDSINGIPSDNTHANLADYTLQIDLASNLEIYLQPAETATFQRHWWGQEGGGGSNGWNYYGVDLGLYRRYFITGISTYLDYARQFTDYWWQWAIDHGRKGQSPRVVNMQAQFIRALDGKPERFPDLYTYAIYFANTTQMPHDLNGVAFDAREAGYATWHLALGAMADPDPTRHASYCSTLASKVTLWNTWQHPRGYWSEDLYSYNDGYPYLPPGTSPWRTDLPIHGLQAAYEVLNDTTSAGCNNVALAALTLVSITKAVDWTYNAGRSNPSLGGNGGVYYDAEYASIGQVPLSVSGTASVNLGSTNVIGVGTSFTTQLNCNSTRYLGFLAIHKVYKVISCSDNTHAVISPAFGTYGEVSNLSGSTLNAADAASSSCASTALYCWDLAIPAGDRNLTRLMPGITGWQYNITHLSTYLTYGDNWFSNAFGGPSAGPGQGGSCGGPGCDGVELDWVGALKSCSVDPTPYCNPNANYGGGNVYFYTGKNHGQMGGAPNAQRHLVDRIGGVLPADNRLIKFSGKISSCSGCSKMQVTITNLANAVESTTICGSSPCDVFIDAKLGYSVFQIDYLNSSNVVINYGSKLRLNF